MIDYPGPTLFVPGRSHTSSQLVKAKPPQVKRTDGKRRMTPRTHTHTHTHETTTVNRLWQLITQLFTQTAIQSQSIRTVCLSQLPTFMTPGGGLTCNLSKDWWSRVDFWQHSLRLPFSVGWTSIMVDAFAVLRAICQTCTVAEKLLKFDLRVWDSFGSLT